MNPLHSKPISHEDRSRAGYVEQELQNHIDEDNERHLLGAGNVWRVEVEPYRHVDSGLLLHVFITHCAGPRDWLNGGLSIITLDTHYDDVEEYVFRRVRDYVSHDHTPEPVNTEREAFLERIVAELLPTATYQSISEASNAELEQLHLLLRDGVNAR